VAKIIQFKPKRATLRLEPRPGSGNCPHCHHKMNVHITHPNGVSSCAARGCRCETRPTGEWPKV
jgi:transcription elongation factor Elf1